MKKLEARFRPPFAATRAFVVVAEIFVPTEGGDRTPRIRPKGSLAAFASPESILSTLKDLVRTTAPESWERLLGLRSRYWSFAAVELSSAERRGDLSGLLDA